MRSFPPAVIALLLVCLAPLSASAQKLSCSPCTYNFGNVQVGSSSTYYIQLTNTASEPLTIQSTDEDGSGFSVGNVSWPVSLTFGSSMQLPIIFAPGTTGSVAGAIALIGNAENSPLLIGLSGNGTANTNPQLTSVPTTLSFGNVTIGSSATVAAGLTATNGPITITADSATNSDFVIQGLSLPVTIAAGKTIQAAIQFTPKAAGTISATANFTTSASSSPIPVQLTGIGVATQTSPQLAVSPATLAFGDVTVGSSVTKTATLTASNAPVTIKSDTLTNAGFSISGLTLPTTIAAGKSLAVTVKFTPSAAGAAAGKATFASNAADSPTAVQFTGTGTAVKATAQLSASPGALAFGNVTVGSSATMTATLTASNAPVTITSYSSGSANYTISGPTLPVTIATGKSVPVTIKFNPSGAGAFSGKANFVSNAANSPMALDLTGTGVAIVEPKLTVSPTTLAFGSVTVGSSANLTATLTASNAAVTITADKSSNSEFAISGVALPVTIAAGKSLSVTVKFTPSGTGAVSGTASFTSNASNSPTALQLSGTGTAAKAGAQLSVSPTSLAFGSVTVGSSASLTATLTASNAAVTISADQSSNSVFAISGLTLPVTIAAGKSVSATIKFTPTATGAVSGSASFTSNATNSPTALQLTGTGTAAKAVGQLSVSPTSLAFGSVTVGSSASLTATLTASNAAVTISADQSSNSVFVISGLTLPTTIAAGKSVSVTVQFSPTATGAVSGTASFTSNATNSPIALQLTGTGTAAKASPQLAVTPATLAFGNVNVGSSASLTATLTASNGAVTITSDQSNSSEFVISGITFPVTIAAGKSISATIQFTPNASGTASGKAGFISNAANSPAIEQLTGTGVAQASHQVDLTWNAGDGNAVGYNIYRGTAQSGPFTEINSALDSSTNYTDSTVVSGSTYYYVATEVNAQGQESAYSNVVKAVVPTP